MNGTCVFSYDDSRKTLSLFFKNWKQAEKLKRLSSQWNVCC